MKVDIKDAKNDTKGSVELPSQFSEPIRTDLITRAVLATQNKSRQPYGAMLGAGMRHAAELSRRRRKYRGSYGFGISRVPRKILSRNGTRMYWVGAEAPGTVGGRRAHPPKVTKDWEQKINIKERRKAIRAALSASVELNTVKERGHKVPAGFPFIIDDSFEALKKTKEVIDALQALGLAQELERADNKKIRAGKGKSRGRKYVAPVGPLLVVSKGCEISKAAQNIPGVTIKPVNELSAELLAPGCHPGRLTLFTKSAIERLEKEKLYM